MSTRQEERGADLDPLEDAPLENLVDRLMHEVRGLRQENVALGRRVRRLEAHSGRGLEHPSEFSDPAPSWWG